MMAPLWILMLGALLAGYINFPSEKLAEFLGKSPSFVTAFEQASRQPVEAGHHAISPANFGLEEEAKKFELTHKEQVEASHSLHHTLMFVSGAIALAGIGLAYVLHLKNRAAADSIANSLAGPVKVIDNKYWVDEIYQAGIVEPLRSLGRAFFTVDRWVVDGIINFIGFVPQASGFVLKLTTQRGYLQGYAAAMLFGVAVILLIIFL